MLNKLIRKDKQFLLNFVSVIGVGLTMYTAIRDTKKACKLVDDSMTNLEKFKKTWKCYIPSTFIATSTVLCIIYSDKVSFNEKVALLNTLTMVQDNYRNLRTAINETCDPDTKEKIMRKTIKEKIPKELYLERTGEKIFYEDYRGRHFSCTIDNVLKAEYLFNKQLAIVGYASLNDFYQLLGLKELEECSFLGWGVRDCYSSIDSTEAWVNFIHEKMVDDDGIEYYHIDYSNHPYPNFDMF